MRARVPVHPLDFPTESEDIGAEYITFLHNTYLDGSVIEIIGVLHMAQTRTQSRLLSVINDAYDRFQGNDAQLMNIEAGQAVAEAIRTTLGPKGMDKMLVDSKGGVIITNDGVSIIRDMDIDHPAAKMISEVAYTQEGEASDGTTTAVVVAGALLGQAQHLLEDDIHPTSIVNGFQIASRDAQAVLENSATEIDTDDAEILTELAKTAMNGSAADKHKHYLSKLVVEAVGQVSENSVVDTDAIQVESINGGVVSDSECIMGTVIEKQPATVEMPTVHTDASVAVLDGGIKSKNPSVEGTISFSDYETAQDILAREETDYLSAVEALDYLGVNVLFAGEDIADLAIDELTRRDVLTFGNVSGADLERVANAVGATICSDVDSLAEVSLGGAGHVEVGVNEWRDVVFVEECADPDNVTLLLRGGTTHVMDERERIVADAIGVVSSAVEDGKICPGGTAMDIEIVRQLRGTAEGIGTREQLAIDAYADAIEVLPRTIAETAGLDPIDTLVELRHAHDTGNGQVGINAKTGDIENVFQKGIVEPVRVKRAAFEAATQAAVQLLRVDDILLSEQLPDERQGVEDDLPR